MAKGGQFEREIAKTLSLWWTADFPEPRDDIFYRTGGSGGRATSRFKKGKSTINSHGDISYLDPIGKPLLDLLVIECKRGYSKHTLHSLLDSPKKGSGGLFEKWLLKAEKDRRAAGVEHWLFITRRDRRKPLVIMPWKLYAELTDETEASFETCNVHAIISVYPLSVEVIVISLEDFLSRVTSNDIKRLVSPTEEDATNVEQQ